MVFIDNFDENLKPLIINHSSNILHNDTSPDGLPIDNPPAPLKANGWMSKYENQKSVKIRNCFLGILREIKLYYGKRKQ